MEYIRTLNKSLSREVRKAMAVSIKNPSLAWFIFKTIIHQKRAKKKRAYWEQQGVHVPPFMIISITRLCNLKCEGCYSRILHHQAKAQLTPEKFRVILNEASQLGTSVIFLAGGEPFLRPEILEISSHYKEIIFPVFTNGILIDRKIVRQLKKQKNLIPMVSIEGHADITDQRRGNGIYNHFRKLARLFRTGRIFWGISLTVTSKNFEEVVNAGYIREMIKNGCRFFVFVEYVPIQEKTECLVINTEQRTKLINVISSSRKRFPAIFLTFPGDEEKYGGCLAAGRGFLHINPEGKLEPCPFAPYSDTNLLETDLKSALKSKLLLNIRQNHQMLTETTGGCALWENREWVKSVMPK